MTRRKNNPSSAIQIYINYTPNSNFIHDTILSNLKWCSDCSFVKNKRIVFIPPQPFSKNAILLRKHKCNLYGANLSTQPFITQSTTSVSFFCPLWKVKKSKGSGKNLRTCLVKKRDPPKRVGSVHNSLWRSQEGKYKKENGFKGNGSHRFLLIKTLFTTFFSLFQSPPVVAFLSYQRPNSNFIESETDRQNTQNQSSPTPSNNPALLQFQFQFFRFLYPIPVWKSLKLSNKTKASSCFSVWLFLRHEIFFSGEVCDESRNNQFPFTDAYRSPDSALRFVFLHLLGIFFCLFLRSIDLIHTQKKVYIFFHKDLV